MIRLRRKIKKHKRWQADSKTLVLALRFFVGRTLWLSSSKNVYGFVRTVKLKPMIVEILNDVVFCHAIIHYKSPFESKKYGYGKYFSVENFVKNGEFVTFEVQDNAVTLFIFS